MYIYNLCNAIFVDRICECLDSCISYNEFVLDVYTHIIHDTKPGSYLLICLFYQPILIQSLLIAWLCIQSSAIYQYWQGHVPISLCCRSHIRNINSGLSYGKRRTLTEIYPYLSCNLRCGLRIFCAINLRPQSLAGTISLPFLV